MSERDILSLPELHEGQAGAVAELRSAGSIRRRLMELGVVRGARIECVHKCRHGDPTAYCIQGAVIALRCEDARHILVSV